MERKRMGKRAQGLSTNAIILIVLGVIILVLLIAGFTLGWSNLLPFLGGGDNVDTIVSQCEVACSTGAVFDYCKDRSVDFGDTDSRGEITANCRGLEFQNIGLSSCGSVGAECYPRGAPLVLDSEAKLGDFKEMCKKAGKAWRDLTTPKKDTDKDCDPQKYGDQDFFCCKAA